MESVMRTPQVPPLSGMTPLGLPETTSAPRVTIERHGNTQYVRSMGKLLKVEKAFQTGPVGEREANRAMEKDSTLAVVAESKWTIYLASKYDLGRERADA